MWPYPNLALWVYCCQRFYELICFRFFLLWVYPMNVIPETRNIYIFICNSEMIVGWNSCKYKKCVSISYVWQTGWFICFNDSCMCTNWIKDSILWNFYRLQFRLVYAITFPFSTRNAGDRNMTAKGMSSRLVGRVKYQNIPHRRDINEGFVLI